MTAPTRLIGQDLRDAVVRVTESIDGDAGAHIEVLPSLLIIQLEPPPLLEEELRPRICLQAVASMASEGLRRLLGHRLVRVRHVNIRRARLDAQQSSSHAARTSVEAKRDGADRRGRFGSQTRVRESMMSKEDGAEQIASAAFGAGRVLRVGTSEWTALHCIDTDRVHDGGRRSRVPAYTGGSQPKDDADDAWSAALRERDEP